MQQKPNTVSFIPMNDSVLPPSTRIKNVRLQVRDLKQSLAFYGDLLGLTTIRQTGNEAQLAPGSGLDHIIELIARKDAIPKPHRSSGLYHIAIRYPTRRSLAEALNRLVERRWVFQGFADHLVSEAIYLADPDGNGVEIYCDRPKEEWRRANGQIAMGSEPLDVDNLMDELHAVPQDDEKSRAIDIGHVHLHVASLARAENFYHTILGFDITQRSYPGALFLSAGGYHHHIGTNIWAGDGAPPPPENAVGLLSFGIAVPDRRTIEVIKKRLDEAKLNGEINSGNTKEEILFTRDFDGIGVEISIDRNE
jgi:catechol 2,3-dioxygenase